MLKTKALVSWLLQYGKPWWRWMSPQAAYHAQICTIANLCTHYFRWKIVTSRQYVIYFPLCSNLVIVKTRLYRDAKHERVQVAAPHAENLS